MQAYKQASDTIVQPFYERGELLFPCLMGLLLNWVIHEARNPTYRNFQAGQLCRPTQNVKNKITAFSPAHTATDSCVRPPYLSGLKRAPGREDDELETDSPQVFHDVGAVLRQ